MYRLSRQSLVSLAALTLVATPGRPVLAQQASYDIVIRGGRVIDPETRLDAIRDVGICRGRIAAVSAARLRGRSTIDATGLIVAPGFIDLHAHGQDDTTAPRSSGDSAPKCVRLSLFRCADGVRRIGHGSTRDPQRGPLRSHARRRRQFAHAEWDGDCRSHAAEHRRMHHAAIGQPLCVSGAGSSYASAGDLLPNTTTVTPWMTRPFATPGIRLAGFISTRDEVTSSSSALTTLEQHRHARCRDQR